MNHFLRLKLAAVSLVVALPFLSVAASAQRQVMCQSNQEVIQVDAPLVCDLAVKKEVKVNDGAFVDANNDPNAAIAHVGDTLTWRVTITNNSTPGYLPDGIITVSDPLPSGLDVISVTASNGDGSYNSATNNWYVDVSTDLTATLTFTTRATTVATLTNTATITERDTCNDGCMVEYADDDATNNTDMAVAMVSTLPQVLGASTTGAVLAATGTSVYVSALAVILIAAALVVTIVVRRQSSTK